MWLHIPSYSEFASILTLSSKQRSRIKIVIRLLESDRNLFHFYFHFRRRLVLSVKYSRRNRQPSFHSRSIQICVFEIRSQNHDETLFSFSFWCFVNKLLVPSFIFLFSLTRQQRKVPSSLPKVIIICKQETHTLTKKFSRKKRCREWEDDDILLKKKTRNEEGNLTLCSISSIHSLEKNNTRQSNKYIICVSRYREYTCNNKSHTLKETFQEEFQEEGGGILNATSHFILDFRERLWFCPLLVRISEGTTVLSNNKAVSRRVEGNNKLVSEVSALADAFLNYS